MLFRRKRKIFAILILIVIITIAINYWFLPLSGETTKTIQEQIHDDIYEEFNNLREILKEPAESDPGDRTGDLSEIFSRNAGLGKKVQNLSALWSTAQSWVSKTQLVDPLDRNMGDLIYALKNSKIIKADLDPRGTQLKLLLTLEGNQEVVYKPKWYSKEWVIDGPVYGGKDRHSSEILGFYLSVILNKTLTPVSVQRNISFVNDILPVASPDLLQTTFKHKHGHCFYGKCHYCVESDPICVSDAGYMSGAAIFNIREVFQVYRSPWQRTYKKKKRAVWEHDMDYCSVVKTKLTRERLLDLIDAAIFDFLIQNGDRHHYETFQGTVLLLDNGKGLGNPYVNHLDILAPLYQCCIIKMATWTQLHSLIGGALKRKLENMPDVPNLVSDKHLDAIQVRLYLILATIEHCRYKNYLHIY